MLRTNWGDAAVWEVISTSKAGPWSPPSATGQLVRDTLSAHIHPRQATKALGQAVLELGGVITAAGARQGAIVDARGWSGLVEMSQTLGKEIGNGVKGQAALLDLACPGAAQLFAEGLHVVPHLDGTVAIGSTSERHFKSADQTDGQLDDLIAKAKRLFPELRDAPCDRALGWREAPSLYPRAHVGPGIRFIRIGLSPMAGLRSALAWPQR